eukprot:6173390-Pleurochrysis_carterae.AAC.1
MSEEGQGATSVDWAAAEKGSCFRTGQPVTVNRRDLGPDAAPTQSPCLLEEILPEQAPSILGCAT